MEFGLLGSLEVRFGGSLVDIRPGLPRTILTLLLLRRGEVVTSSYLIDTLWDGNAPLNPANALQTQISYLRKRFNAHSSTQLIVTRAGGYSLTVDRAAIDAHRFEDAVTAAIQLGNHDPVAQQASLVSLDAALALWRGPALADVIDQEFARGESTRLEELRLTAIEVRTDIALALGQHRAVSAELASLITEHPLRERLHYQLMLALYRSGRQAEALRAFANARRLLVDELGIEPGSELRVLEQRILEQDTVLDGAGHLTDQRRGVDSELVAAPPLAGGQAPMDSVGRHRGRLPAAVSDLIGRHVEIDRITALLGRSRVVTLTGPAGAGKSRLAIETARRRTPIDEVWFVDLAAVNDPESVVPAVAQSLNLTVAEGDDGVGSIAAALSRSRGLLVLDTCEHVVEAVAVLVSRIVRDADDVRILATSRRALNIKGEVGWPVPPLAVAPADVRDPEELLQYSSTALFVERATAVRPDFSLTATNAPDVASICRKLDGLPLAIELAAARVDVLSPRSIADRLRQRFDLLVDGGRDVLPRQRSLRGAIEWSVDLLSQEERSFFARLGVFATSFDLDAARVVTGESEDRALELMAALVRQSMVVLMTEHDRYLLLHTLKAYAVELLPHLDADETRDRHAHHYLVMAENAEKAIRGTDQLRWLTNLRLERANHRASLEWLVTTAQGAEAARLVGALRWYFTLEGRLGEAEQQMQRVLQFADLPGASRARVLGGLALVTSSSRQMNRSEALALECVAEARAIDDKAETAFGLSLLALAQSALGDLDVSERNLHEALQLSATTGDRWTVALVRVVAARNAIEKGGDDRVAASTGALEAARAAGDPHLVGVALRLAAHVSLHSGDGVEAEIRALEALDHAEAAGSSEGMLGALHVLGSALDHNAKPELAQRVQLRALHLAATTGHCASICDAIDGLASLAMQKGHVEHALRLADTADSRRAQLGMPRRREESERIAGIRSAAEPSRTPLRLDSFDQVIDELLDGYRQWNIGELAPPLGIQPAQEAARPPYDLLLRNL